MDDFNDRTPYEELGPHPRLTSHAAALRSKRPSAKTQRLIGELGLRYPPASQTDLEQHAATLALLASDLADLDADHLERAIENHVAKSVFMPKAAELRAAANAIATKHGKADLHALARKYNERLIGEGRRDIRWIVIGTEMKIEQMVAFQPTSTRPISATEEEITAYCKASNKAKKLNNSSRVGG